MLTLDILKKVAHGITESFEKDCEVVIHAFHDKEFEECSIVYIENGEVSGRKEGDGPSQIVLEAIKKAGDDMKDQYSYLTRTQDGRILKSSSIFIRDDEEDITYILGINYDITAMMTARNTLDSFIKMEDEENKPHGFIPKNVNELLDELIKQSVQLVGKPVAWMNKEEKVQAIQFLNDSGAFLVTRSADKVSAYFGISKYTLYSYINVNK